MPTIDLYNRIANGAARFCGRPKVFAVASVIVVGWMLTGPIFHFSDTWQLFINTSTSVVTFLMVFVIQNSQNRDTIAIQIKLDELIRATEGARNELIDLEELQDEALETFRQRYEELARAARDEASRRGTKQPGIVDAPEDVLRRS